VRTVVLRPSRTGRPSEVAGGHVGRDPRSRSSRFCGLVVRSTGDRTGGRIRNVTNDETDVRAGVLLTSARSGVVAGDGSRRHRPQV
jgi:hypothetical protein